MLTHDAATGGYDLVCEVFVRARCDGRVVYATSEYGDRAAASIECCSVCLGVDAVGESRDYGDVVTCELADELVSYVLAVVCRLSSSDDCDANFRVLRKLPTKKQPFRWVVYLRQESGESAVFIL